MNNNILLGVHVSIAQGLENAIIEGEETGSSCIQIFTKSNRQWKTRLFKKDEIEFFKKKLKNSSIKQVNAHASYLINLTSKNSDVQKKSIESLILEIEKCAQLDIDTIVLHPGTFFNENKNESLSLLAHKINEVIEKTESFNTIILLETMAGQGSSIGSSFEDLGFIIQRIENKKKIGICLDTCHIFAAGYDFRTKKEYEKMWALFDTLIGKKYVKLIHCNDSKKECGSKVDRHEHIGKGKIGLEAFSFFMNDTTLASIPKILETPKEDGYLSDIQNIRTLQNLIK